MNNQLSLKIPSLLENIRIIESFIDKAKEDFAINDDIYGNILIAVTEAVNNAIIHGNGSDKAKDVHLALKISANNVLFTVEDEGDGFDQNELSDPTDPSALTSEGGRGIYLIKHLADEVKFDKDGTRIKMTFYIM
ncbi:MAG: serine/threonine-protein kinase RsbW [Arenicella sp.]|jgi:serine/threonine-protein kinase RsbW